MNEMWCFKTYSHSRLLQNTQFFSHFMYIISGTPAEMSVWQEAKTVERLCSGKVGAMTEWLDDEIDNTGIGNVVTNGIVKRHRWKAEIAAGELMLMRLTQMRVVMSKMAGHPPFVETLNMESFLSSRDSINSPVQYAASHAWIPEESLYPCVSCMTMNVLE